MAKYTKKNLKLDVKNAAAEHGVAGHAMHHANNVLDLRNQGLSYQKTAAGNRVPFGHKHSAQEEVYVVISGSGHMKLDDEIVELAHMDAVRVAPEVMRGIQAGDEGIEFIVVGAPLTESDRGEMDNEFWD